MHYHIRFLKSDQEFDDNFNFHEDLLPDADIEELKNILI